MNDISTVNGGGGVGGIGQVRTRPRTPVPDPPEVEACNITEADTGNVEVTQSQLDTVNSMLNGFFGQDSWDRSRYTEDLSIRNEHARYFRQGHGWTTFHPMTSTPCTVNFNPPLIPTGDGILMHTHPYRAGEQPVCRINPYENAPSEADLDFVRNNPSFNLGVILDYDGVILHDNNGNWVFIPGQCGFKRTSK